MSAYLKADSPMNGGATSGKLVSIDELCNVLHCVVRDALKEELDQRRTEHYAWEKSAGGDRGPAVGAKHEQQIQIPGIIPRGQGQSNGQCEWLTNSAVVKPVVPQGANADSGRSRDSPEVRYSLQLDSIIPNAVLAYGCNSSCSSSDLPTQSLQVGAPIVIESLVETVSKENDGTASHRGSHMYYTQEKSPSRLSLIQPQQGGALKSPRTSARSQASRGSVGKASSSAASLYSGIDTSPIRTRSLRCMMFSELEKVVVTPPSSVQQKPAPPTNCPPLPASGADDRCDLDQGPTSPEMPDDAKFRFVSFAERSQSRLGSKSTTNSLKRESSSKIKRSRLHQLCLNLVETSTFDCFIVCSVSLNALIIGLQSDYMVSHLDEDTPAVFAIFEVVFCVIFTLELILRLYAYRKDYFTRDDRWWNIFDMLVVGAQYIDLIFSWISIKTDTKNSNFSFMRIMRVLRLVRIIRVVRLVRFIQELRTMILSIASSFKHLCWTMVLLLLMIYTISVYICQLIADSGHQHPGIMQAEPMLFQYFGSIPRSLLSLYQAMTGGVDWNQLLPLLEQAALPNPWVSIGFSMYIAFAVFAMLNVVTGVFVESALSAAKMDRDAELAKHVRQLFQLIMNDSGKVDWEDFVRELNEPQFAGFLKSLEIDKNEARALFLLLDTDESGTIDCDEFTQGVLRLRGPATAIDLATLMYFNKRMVSWQREIFDKMATDVEMMNRRLQVIEAKTAGGAPAAPGAGSRRRSLQGPVDTDSEDSNHRPSTPAPIGFSIPPTSGSISSRASCKSAGASRASYDNSGFPAGFATWSGVKSEASHRASDVCL